MWNIVTQSSTFCANQQSRVEPAHPAGSLPHLGVACVCGRTVGPFKRPPSPLPPVLPRALTSLYHRASSYALTALCIIRKCRSAERYQNWSQIVCSLPIRCYSFKFKFENNQKWQLEPKHEGWEAFFDGNPNDIVCWRLEHFVGKERTGLWLKKELFSKIISGRGEAVKFRPLRSEWGDTELAFVANIWHACN